MAPLHTKAIIYDNTCPMCALYTRAFIKTGVLNENGRVAFTEATPEMTGRLDFKRARHEIPLLDRETGEVLYGLDGLTLVLSHIFPVTKSFITKTWFKNFFRPLYNFISYNRRVIAGSPNEVCGISYGPDFSLKWRLLLIATGMLFTACSIYGFSVLAGIQNIFTVFVFVGSYFNIMMAANLYYNKSFQQRVNYLGHLATLGIIESTLFMATALIAKFTGLPALLFAGQGACRLFALWMHQKRVVNNQYHKGLSYVFGLGALAMILFLAVVLK